MDDVKAYPPYLDCPKPRKPMTNADRIRAMNDKKLAVFLCEHGACSFKTCPGSVLCNGSDGKANGILKWLQQPSEGE